MKLQPVSPERLLNTGAGHAVKAAFCRAAFGFLPGLLILWGLSGAGWALEKTETAGNRTLEALVRATESLYNRDFQQAEVQVLKVIAESPDDPSGYFYLAMVNWSQLAAGFWTKEVLDLYEQRIDRAVDIALRAVNRDRELASAHFYLGGALGFKARFYLMQQRYFASIFPAVRATESLRACHGMDPENRDVLFGLGVFEYYTAKLSGFLWFLSHFLIHPSDREAGLQKLHTSAEEGTVTRFEAQSTLLHIYLFMEDQPDRALPLAERLAAAFPRNPRFAYLLGAARLRLGGEVDLTAELIRERRDRAFTPVKRLMWEHRDTYLRATEDLLRGRLDAARAGLNAILAQVDPQTDPFMAAFPQVKLGMCHDLAGEREAALSVYQRVRAMENGAGAQFLAEKYLEGPIRPDDPFLLY